MVRTGHLNRIQGKTNKIVHFYRHKEANMTMSFIREPTQRQAD